MGAIERDVVRRDEQRVILRIEVQQPGAEKVTSPRTNGSVPSARAPSQMHFSMHSAGRSEWSTTSSSCTTCGLTRCTGASMTSS